MKRELNDFSIFSHIRLNNQSWLITESYGYNPGIPNSYTHLGLVEGTEKVAVIDSGTAGTAGLRRYIEEVILEGKNKKPILCLQTHNHIDHMSGCMQFDERYMHPLELDAEDFKWQTNEDRRLLSDDADLVLFANFDWDMIRYCREHYYKVKPTVEDFKPIQDGDVIDLGGVTLEVVHLPGHTKGSCCFYDAKNHVAYCGDSLASMGEPQTVKERFTKVKTRFAPDTMMFDAHGGLRRMAQIDDIIDCCDEIIEGVNLEQDKEGTMGKLPWRFTKEKLGIPDRRPKPDPTMKRVEHVYRSARVAYTVKKEQ